MDVDTNNELRELVGPIVEKAVGSAQGFALLYAPITNKPDGTPHKVQADKMRVVANFTSPYVAIAFGTQLAANCSAVQRPITPQRCDA